MAIANAHRLIPTNERQRRSLVLQLYTNTLDSPKYNLLHKVQQPVADINAPGFHEKAEKIIIPPEMMFLHQHCLAKPNDSFFISTIAHTQVISKACGLLTQELITKMRGWVFLKKKLPKGAPCRHQSFSESVCTRR